MVSLFLKAILLAELSSSCITTSIMNFKFYVTSGTNDWIVSEQYPNGAYAVVVPALASSTPNPPEASWVWESPYIEHNTITIIRYFFVLGNPISATFIGAINDNGLVIVNGGASCSISGFNSLYSCDFTSSITSGLNKLEITANDLGIEAHAMYKLTIVSNIV